MGLEEVRKVYEKLGRDDPMYAVLTDDRYRGNRWDPEAFFESGRKEIDGLLEYVDGIQGRALHRGDALDFGCGVGRLSQALARDFERVVGVDISHTMIEKALEFDRAAGRVRYIVNTTADLAILESGSFDLIYSNITLQHIPPDAALAYVREFVRLLRPGGLAVFQMRNGPRISPGSVRSLLYKLRREHFRRFWKRIRGRPAYEMHFVARSVVEELVAEAGGRMVDVVDVSRGRPDSSPRYCVTR